MTIRVLTRVADIVGKVSDGKSLTNREARLLITYFLSTLGAYEAPYPEQPDPTVATPDALKRNALPRFYRMRSVHHTLLTTIDTPLSAYVLGAIVASATVQPQFERLVFEYAPLRDPLIVMLRDALVPRGDILPRAGKPTSYFSVHSPKLIAELERHGVITRERFHLADRRWPRDVPAHLLGTLALGMLDAAGFVDWLEQDGQDIPVYRFMHPAREVLSALAAVLPVPSELTASKHGWTLSVRGADTHTVRAWLQHTPLDQGFRSAPTTDLIWRRSDRTSE